MFFFSFSRWQVALKICFGCQKVQMVFHFSLSAMSQLLQCHNLEADLLTQYLHKDDQLRWFYLWQADQLPFWLLYTLCTQMFHFEFFWSGLEIWPTKFLKTDVTKKKISQELKHILPSCKKHWKAYLILL